MTDKEKLEKLFSTPQSWVEDFDEEALRKATEDACRDGSGMLAKNIKLERKLQIAIEALEKVKEIDVVRDFGPAGITLIDEDGNEKPSDARIVQGGKASEVADEALNKIRNEDEDK